MEYKIDMKISSKQNAQQPHPWGNWFTVWVGKMMLKITGWRFEGGIPNTPKMIIIVAPHTSNWDFYYGITTALCLKTRIYWMGKHTLFRFPIKHFLRWLGGIPINRRAAVGVVEQMEKRILLYRQ